MRSRFAQWVFYGMAVAGASQDRSDVRLRSKTEVAPAGMWKSAVDEKIAPVVHAHVQRYGILQQWLQGRVCLQSKASWYCKGVILIHGDRHRRQRIHQPNVVGRKRSVHDGLKAGTSRQVAELLQLNRLKRIWNC